MKATLTVLLLIFLAACGIQTHTRQPEGDLKTHTQEIPVIDNRVHIESLEITKIDTTLNLFKAESLVGVNVSGYILHSEKATSTLDAFENVEFVETVNSSNHDVHIAIVPVLGKKHGKKSNAPKTAVKYTTLSDKTTFEFYVEKKIFTTGFGGYQVHFSCGEQIQSIGLVRKK